MTTRRTVLINIEITSYNDIMEVEGVNQTLKFSNGFHEQIIRLHIAIIGRQVHINNKSFVAIGINRKGTESI